jgi:pyruvate dehydrogenase E2 component (dihydrolipoamide acetyltransferase)
MPIPITIPRLGWTMEEGVFIGWLKADGDTVRAGEALFTLESDKATEDIECLDGGVLRIPADAPRNGDKVAVGAVIGHLIQAGEGENGRTGEGEKGRKAEVERVKSVSPRAKRAALSRGIDWKTLHGSGRNGRIRDRDVQAAAATNSEDAATAVSTVRRTIAERMLTSHQSTAPVTLTTMVDATNLASLRNQFYSVTAIVPAFTDILLKLTALALQKHPPLNARWDGERMVLSAGIHIGIAVDTDAGLLVPVLRDVPSLTLAQVASRSRDLIERARQRKLTTQELQGGTFTVTNLGAFGIDAFTPIINYPECAILGVGRIQRRPVVIGDAIVARDQITLSLTFDHRIVDGAPAARFLQMLSGLIENAAEAFSSEPRTP